MSRRLQILWLTPKIKEVDQPRLGIALNCPFQQILIAVEEVSHRPYKYQTL